MVIKRKEGGERIQRTYLRKGRGQEGTQVRLVLQKETDSWYKVRGGPLCHKWLMRLKVSTGKIWPN